MFNASAQILSLSQRTNHDHRHSLTTPRTESDHHDPRRPMTAAPANTVVLCKAGSQSNCDEVPRKYDARLSNEGHIMTVIAVIAVIIVVVLLLLGSSVRLVQQYEKGVVLRFGRLLPAVSARRGRNCVRSSSTGHATSLARDPARRRT